MPKMKTKSGTKKRFKISGSGKLVFKASQSRHLLRNKSKSMKRKRGMEILNDSDSTLVFGWMPYAQKKGA